MPYPCHMCSEPALDAAHGLEIDREGNCWVFCRPCDAWTSHPPATEPEPTPVSDPKNPKPGDKPTPQPGEPKPAQDDLGDVVRRISEGMGQLTARGLNRRAIVTLLKDSTGVPKKTIEQVLGGLESLAKDFTNRGVTT